MNFSYDLGKDTYNVKIVCYDTEVLSYLKPKIWDFVPSKIKNS